MNWCQWIGLRPTQADLANDLLRSARQSGQTGWVYDAADFSLRNADRVISLVNIHREYAQAGYLARPGLLRKYQAMLAPMEQSTVPRHWTLAQTRIFPILRSGYERTIIEVQYRNKEPFPPRAAKAFSGQLEVVIGYDHGPTVSQIKVETATDWGISIDELIHRARANLRALPPPTWEPAGEAVWKLASEAGYSESFLQCWALLQTHHRRPASNPCRRLPDAGGIAETPVAPNLTSPHFLRIPCRRSQTRLPSGKNPGTIWTSTLNRRTSHYESHQGRRRAGGTGFLESRSLY
jgi:hypothetical protein